MSGISREFLSTNNDGIDVHLGGSQSSFLGRPHHLSANFVFGHHDVSPNNALAPGGKGIYDIQQAFDYVGKCDLVINIGPVTSTAATTGYPRYIDWWAFAFITNVLVKWSANRIQEFSGKDLMVLHCLTRRTDDSIEDLVYGGLQSLAYERHLNTTVAQEAIIPLDCLIYGQRPSQYLPINIDTLRKVLTLEITLAPLSQIIETDGTDLVAASFETVLRVQHVHVTEPEQQAILDEAKRENKELNILALSRCVTVQEHQNDNIIPAAAATVTQSLKLDSINRPTKELIFYAVQDSDLPPGNGFATNIQPFNFQEIQEMSLEGYGRTILPTVSGRYVKYRLNNMFHSADPSKNIYTISHSLAPQSPGDLYGYINYNLVNNPTFKYKMPSAWATTGKLNVLAQTVNISMLTQGEFKVVNA